MLKIEIGRALVNRCHDELVKGTGPVVNNGLGADAVRRGRVKSAERVGNLLRVWLEWATRLLIDLHLRKPRRHV